VSTQLDANTLPKLVPIPPTSATSPNVTPLLAPVQQPRPTRTVLPLILAPLVVLVLLLMEPAHNVLSTSVVRTHPLQVVRPQPQHPPQHLALHQLLPQPQLLLQASVLQIVPVMCVILEFASKVLPPVKQLLLIVLSLLDPLEINVPNPLDVI
jgi:hypothetical protein